MASWAAVLALSGFHYSGVQQQIDFAATPAASQVFWSNGYAWGMFSQTPQNEGVEVELKVLHGSLTLQELTLNGAGTVRFENPIHLNEGEELTVKIPEKND